MSFGESLSQQLCRLCLGNVTGCVSIFSEYLDEELLDFPKIIKNCVGVEVSESDGYTCMVCLVCRKMVLRYNAFKTACQEAQYRLKHMPQWLSSGPRDPLSTGPRKEDMASEKGSKGGVESGHRGSKDNVIRPLAMWTVSEGCWRGTTVHREETIISDVLDDEMANADDDVALGHGGNETEFDVPSPVGTCDSSTMDVPSPGIPPDEHNYSSMTLEDEPLQMCSVVMDTTEDGEDAPKVEEEVSKKGEAELKEDSDGFIVEADLNSPASQSSSNTENAASVSGSGTALRWQVMADGKVLPVKSSPKPISPIPILPKPTLREIPKTDNATPVDKDKIVLPQRTVHSVGRVTAKLVSPLKDKVIRGLGGNAFRGRIRIKTPVPDCIKKIIIRRLPLPGKYVPHIKGARITEELQRTAIEQGTAPRNGVRSIMVPRNGSTQVTVSRNGLTQRTISQSELMQGTASRNGVTQITLPRNGSTQVTVSRNSVTQRTIPRTPLMQETVQRNGVTQGTVLRTPLMQGTVPRTPLMQGTAPRNGVTQGTVPRTPLIQGTVPGNPITQGTVPGNAITQGTVPGNAITQGTVQRNAVPQGIVQRNAISRVNNSPSQSVLKITRLNR